MNLSTHGVVSLVRNSRGEFLFLEESRQEMNGRWAPPHGRCENSDESEEAGVIRETFEETGLNVKPIKKLLTQAADTKVKTVSFWLVDIEGGNLEIDSQEASNHCWSTLHEAQNLNLYPGTKIFIDKVLSGEISLE